MEEMNGRIIRPSMVVRPVDQADSPPYVHIPSSANLPANALATRALSGDGGLQDLEVPLSFIRGLLNADKRA
ncbi:hypothetical protein ACET3Z_032067 [Daucus carota]